ncbi:MAG: hypothetical protein HC922_08870 [Leptolyngbyaceae cyanobacterium SM2_3_12]|nr:hypothetical protein [Leptolyngbyaceae cyanobacterium SM2_3_12]
MKASPIHGFLAATLLAAAIPAYAQTSNAERTLALCKSPNHTMRVYVLDGVTNLRAYDRKNEGVWLNTAALRQPNPEGYDYLNERGEVQVKLFVPNSEDLACSITIGDNPPEMGEVLVREPSSGD